MSYKIFMGADSAEIFNASIKHQYNPTDATINFCTKKYVRGMMKKL